jgi:predicted ribosome quality control (RQC) complex YloA/Tae2 family protein
MSESTKGYIIAKAPKSDQNTSAAAPGRLMYDDFHPFRPRQFEDVRGIEILEYESYNKTVDEFFSSIEGQKLDSRLQERQTSATKKIESFRRQHEERLESLQKVGELNIRKAQAIEANIERVEEATNAVNGLIAQGRDWADMARLIESEHHRGNPVAQLIKLPLKLYENTVTLLLAEPEEIEDDSGYISDSDGVVDSEDEGESPSVVKSGSAGGSKRLAIDIDLALSPWANATQYYEQKRTAASKEHRTAQASTIAIKSAEKKITADLKKGLKQEKDVLRPIRQPYWFEKFYYFISSDRYLVLSGKDVQQNDLLYQKYLQDGDVFVHADINQAAIVIIRNNPDTPNAPIPPSTLSQAASLCVATSTAWDSKAMMAAWWVSASQVSKTSPNGDYLGPGHFHISGEKNYLPPSPLLVGIAIVFEISEASVANHTKHHVEDMTSDDASKIEKEAPSQAPDIESEGDDSDDFPDVAPNDGMDSDNEFPDVDPNAGMDSDDEAGPSNPLDGNADRDAHDSSTVSLPSRPLTQDTKTAKPQPEDNNSRQPAKKRGDKQKAGKPSDEPNQDSDRPSRPSAPATRDSSIPRSTTTTKSTSTPAPLPRGKRTKLKKAAAKYAEQDEDDRAAALARLGSATNVAQKAAAAAEQRERDRLAAEDKQRRREAHFRAAAEAEAARQRARAAAAAAAATTTGEDGEAVAAEQEEEEAARAAPLERLVGRAAPGDEIVAGWTVCAPWAALATHKFRAKMQPGSEKKGKATREVLARWRADATVPRNVDPAGRDPERVWPREREVVEGLREADAVGGMFAGKVRVMMPGGAAGGKQGGGAARGTGKSARGGKGSKKT